MVDVFRFVARRAPRRGEAGSTVEVRTSRELATNLRTALAAGAAAAEVRRAAKAARTGKDALASRADLASAAALASLEASLGGRTLASQGDVAAAVRAAFGADATKVTTGEAFARDRARLSDALVAAAVLGDDAGFPSAEAARALRWMAVVERVAEGGGGTIDLARLRRAPLGLPPEFFPLRIAAPARAPEPPSRPAPKDERAALILRRDTLKAAHAALLRVLPDDVSAEAGARRPRGAGARPEAAPTAGAAEPANDGAAAARAPLPRLTEAAAGALAAPVRAALTSLGLDAAKTPLPTVVKRVGAEWGDVARRLAALEAPRGRPLARLGGGWIGPSRYPGTPPPVPAGGTAPPPAPPGPVETAPPVPGFRADVGDLLVVRETLARYEPGEVAHVENVLAGESKERLHRRLVRTEDTLVTETETRRDEERDQQTTERFELQTESTEVLRRDLRLDADASVSARYGPMVDVDASVSASVQQSTERTDRTASTFAKDVTERAVTRVSERRRSERTTRRVEAVVERNTHALDNRQGIAPVLGVYQWLDKVHQARVVRYGRRLLFDVVVPEPAALYLHALVRRAEVDPDLVEPPPFEESALDLDEATYAALAQRYGATGIEPPPEPHVTVARAFEGLGDGVSGESTKSADLLVPEGYSAFQGSVVVALVSGAGNHGVDVLVGRNGMRFDGDGEWLKTFPLSHEVGALAVGIKTFRIHVYAAVVQVHCVRTDRALDAWRLRTHQAIREAYRERVREYEERRTRAGMIAQQDARSRSSEANERLVRGELRRGALAVLAGERFDGPPAVTTDASGLPAPDPATVGAFARRVRFLEQAFEWPHMLFTFQPYFWGRKEHWLERAFLDDVDPRFGEFLRAGAARVVLSVRPGFEAAVTHFLDTGEVWQGGDLPEIASPLYVPLIQEIREANDVPGLEAPVGEPWEVRVPTTLVRLREDGTLPAWPTEAPAPGGASP